MAWRYEPDPMPPMLPGMSGYGQQPQVIYVPTPNATPIKGKGGRKASLKQMWKARSEIDELIKAVEEQKKKDKPKEDKKKDGLNWVELTLFVVLASLPIACIELLAIISIAKVLPHS